MKKVFLVDAHSFCYRAFYALPSLLTSKGQPTGAVYGFSTFIKRILSDEKPDYLAFCFDSGKPSFRIKEFADYKINRPSMPDELRAQMPKIKELIKAFGLSLIEKESYEADDIVATLAKQFKKGFEVFIITSDKDMYQLVNEHIKIYPQIKEPVFVDEQGVVSKFGVAPKEIVDFLALAGDSSDNIPGARGIGEKTAAKLISKYGSVENIFNNLDDISGSVKDKLANSKQDVLLSRKLATLDQNVPIDIDIEHLKVGRPDEEKLFELFKELEFHSLLKTVFSKPVSKIVSKRIKVDLKQLSEQALKEKELILYFGQEELWLATENFFCLFDPADKNACDILADQKINKVSDDLKTVKLYLLKSGVAFSGLFLDISVMFYLLDSGKPDYSLSSLSLSELKRPVEDKTLQAQDAFSLVDELRSVLFELEKSGLDRLLFDVEMPLLEILADMQHVGVKIDSGFLEELAGKFSSRVETLTQKIFALSGREFNLNSPKQLSQVLFEELKLPMKKKRKFHASTDEAVLRSLCGEYEICRYILDYRQLTKLMTTYIQVLPRLMDENKRIHASFNQTSTQTGRLSSSDPNLQNIPIKTDEGALIRRAFISSGKEHVLLSADYSQIELRILAHLSGEENLIRAFEDNEDIHTTTASSIFEIDKEKVDDRMRDIAKRVNFGIIYGISAFGLAKDLGVGQDEAQAFIENYFDRFPRIREFMNDCIAKACSEGFVSTILGRRRYLPAINSRNIHIAGFAQRQAVNMPVQGTAADLIKKAMVDIYKYCSQRSLCSKMIIQVHDELVFDCPEKEADEMQKAIKSKMEKAMELKVAVKVVLKRGRNWLDMKEVA